MSKITPVILCGGKGSRLWPLSRESFPKQFLPLIPGNNNSLLQITALRVSNSDYFESPILICNEDHRFIVAEQLREIDIIPKSIILEPFGRNTAPAIALAALKSLEFDVNTILLVLSSDHFIKDEKKFINTAQAGLKYADNGKLITFGIIPNSPHTGYGYIEIEKGKKNKLFEANKVVRFIEKPKLEIAKKIFEQENFLWNSGIFMFHSKSIIGELENTNKELISVCQESLEGNLLDLDFQRLNKKTFKKCPDISIDIAVMEKTKNALVLPLEIGWNDIGSWEAIWDISPKTETGNVIQGNIIAKKTENCLIKTDKKLVVTLGINNLLIVNTNDALLIAEKNNSQEFKEIVKELKNSGIKEVKENKKTFRPWGNYISLVEDNRWQVKLISVKPGERLSQQKHHHRSEHWIVVSGTAKVEVDNHNSILSENQSVYIPLGSIHRLSNPGKIPLLLIEVQSGSYLGEDDIERFQDNYGRITS